MSHQISMPDDIYYMVAFLGAVMVLIGVLLFLREFNAEFSPRDARYIKIKSRSMGNTPGWHPGAGRPANMLIDEIVVE